MKSFGFFIHKTWNKNDLLLPNYDAKEAWPWLFAAKFA